MTQEGGADHEQAVGGSPRECLEACEPGAPDVPAVHGVSRGPPRVAGYRPEPPPRGLESAPAGTGGARPGCPFQRDVFNCTFKGAGWPTSRRHRKFR